MKRIELGFSVITLGAKVGDDKSKVLLNAMNSEGHLDGKGVSRAVINGVSV